MLHLACFINSHPPQVEKCHSQLGQGPIEPCRAASRPCTRYRSFEKKLFFSDCTQEKEPILESESKRTIRTERTFEVEIIFFIILEGRLLDNKLIIIN